MSVELTLSEWQAEGGHQEWSNLSAQLCPGIYKQQATFRLPSRFKLNKLNESVSVVQIFPTPQILDVPHIAEGDPTFLGGCHTDNNTAPGGFGRSGTAVEQVHRSLLK